MKQQLLSSILMFAAAVAAHGEETMKVASPSGRLEVAVTLDDDSHLTYSVMRDGCTVISPSRLGLNISGTTYDTFSRGIEQSLAAIDHTYTIPHGKKSTHADRCNELTVECKGTGGRNVTVVFRVYDDAVAFRYKLSNRKNYELKSEITEFNISDFRQTWVQTYKTDYSDYYNNHTWSSLQSVEKGFCEPMLIEAGDDTYILLTESAAYASMAASKLVAGTQNGQLTLEPAGTSTIISDTFESPWRTLIIGSLSDIVASDVVTSLNPDSDMTDISWIEPGRVAWNWGAEDGDSAPTEEQAHQYIDLAAYMGWEYFLLDDGWDGRIDLKSVVDYADSKGVKLLIWSHQNRFANNIDQIDAIFSQWADLGIKGVKIDFFENDGQDMLSKYEKLLESAAAHKLLINFHGCTKPSGMERRYPHLMTMEAVLGGEFYMFNTTMTPASHVVNLALTRNVLGSMDYTPVKFGNKKSRVITNTTWAYQATLPVLFESSLQCFCDCPANLTGSVAEPLFRNLPTTWDDVVCLEAVPADRITLARRKGDDWWLSTVTSSARTVSPDLSFLTPGVEYSAHIYTEGVHRSDIDFRIIEHVTSDSDVSLELGENSGAAIVFTRSADMLRPIALKREAEDYSKYCQKVSDAKCSGGKYVTGAYGKRPSISFDDIEVENDGEYYLTIFYVDNADHDAYIQVNDGDKEYHSFKAVSSQMSGDNIAFKTIPVTLRAGTNTIVYGNENATASPGVDRIEVTGYFTSGGQTGVNAPVCDALLPDVEVSGHTLHVTTVADGSLTLYDLAGRPVSRMDVSAGGGEMNANVASGMYIVCVTSANVSVSKKIIIR